MVLVAFRCLHVEIVYFLIFVNVMAGTPRAFTRNDRGIGFIFCS